MRRNKGLQLICVLVFSAAVSAGCGSSAQSQGTTAEDNVSVNKERATEEGEKENQADDGAEAKSMAGVGEENMVLGQITAIDGAQITIALSDRPEGMGEVAPEGEPGQEPPEDLDKEKGTGEEGSTQEPPEVRRNNMPPEQDKNITLSGEEKTITVSENTKIILLDKSEGEIGDLKAEDIVKVEMDGDSVLVISMFGMEAPEGIQQSTE